MHTVQAFRRKYDTTLHTLLRALFTSLQFRCHQWMKEIEQAATVLGGSPQTVDHRNSDFVTVFYRARHLHLRNGRYAVLVIVFIGLQYYSYNKNLIRLNPDLAGF